MEYSYNRNVMNQGSIDELWSRSLHKRYVEQVVFKDEERLGSTKPSFELEVYRRAVRQEISIERAVEKGVSIEELVARSLNVSRGFHRQVVNQGSVDELWRSQSSNTSYEASSLQRQSVEQKF